MTSAGDREWALRKEIIAVRDVYHLAEKPEVVQLFAEDYDFLAKRGQISGTGYLVSEQIEVRRGTKKRKQRRKRPPESLF